jgi:hypothetical protein
METLGPHRQLFGYPVEHHGLVARQARRHGNLLRIRIAGQAQLRRSPGRIDSKQLDYGKCRLDWGQIPSSFASYGGQGISQKGPVGRMGPIGRMDWAGNRVQGKVRFAVGISATLLRAAAQKGFRGALGKGELRTGKSAQPAGWKPALLWGILLDDG